MHDDNDRKVVEYLRQARRIGKSRKVEKT